VLSLVLVAHGLGQEAVPVSVVRALAGTGAGDLSIGRFINGQFLAVPFGRGVEAFDVRPSFFFEASQFSQDGRSLVGYSRGKVTVLGQRLEVIWERSIAPANVLSLAVSPGGNEVILETIDLRSNVKNLIVLPKEGPEETVFSGPAGNDASTPPQLSWDRTGARVALEREGKICVLDLASKANTVVAAGTVPTWSPDGRVIAYRDTSGHAEFLRVDSGKSEPIGVSSISTTAMLHWSPDSRYVFVREERASRALSRSCFTDGRFVVYRLSDLSSEIVYDPCDTRDSTFGWLAGTSTWVAAARATASHAK